MSEEAVNDIQFLDIYTGTDWDFFLDEKQLKSEILEDDKGNQKRHRLAPEIKMIPSKDYIQIEMTDKKMLP